MNPSARHLPMEDKEKEDIPSEELRPQSQSSLLTLPEAGSPERLIAERKLVRKLDMRLLPTVAVIYIMNYIDVSRLVCLILALRFL
jgi:hypothetical protein